MELCWGHDEVIAEWMWQRFPDVPQNNTKLPKSGTYRAVGILDKEGLLKGAAALVNITEHKADACIILLQGCNLTRKNIRHIVRFGFDVLNLVRVNCEIRDDNVKSQKLVTQLGFKNYF